jgi:site-specific DNA-methyltransferase (adenine-specific)
MSSFIFKPNICVPVQVEIYNDDCVKLMDDLPNNSIDCIITDPPYFIDKIDSKMDDDKKQVKELYDLYLQVSQILFKKLKPGGFFLSFSSPRLYDSIDMACENAGFEIIDMINWKYTESMPKEITVSHAIDNLKVVHEQKDELKDEYTNCKTPMIKSCFEPICVAMKPPGERTDILNEIRCHTGLIELSQKVGIDNDCLYNNHITVKPIALIKYLISIFSKKGSTILDPFMGSGTTAVACLHEGRSCIGYEIDKKYFNISHKRVNSPQK